MKIVVHNDILETFVKFDSSLQGVLLKFSSKKDLEKTIKNLQNMKKNKCLCYFMFPKNWNGEQAENVMDTAIEQSKKRF